MEGSNSPHTLPTTVFPCHPFAQKSIICPLLPGDVHEIASHPRRARGAQVPLLAGRQTGLVLGFIFLFFWWSRLTLPGYKYIIASSNLSRRTKAWFACLRRRHAMKRRSELGRVSIYGDDLHRAASACADGYMCAASHLYVNI